MDSHLVLCRRSGQQVWTTRLPHTQGVSERVVGISWSPDGQQFALLLAKETCVIYDVRTGRPLQSQDETHISSVAWTQPTTTDANTRSLSERAADVTSILNPLKSVTSTGARNSFAAVGTSDGKIRISVYGALNIDDIQVSASNDKVYLVTADETMSEYACIQGTTLYVFRGAHIEPNETATRTRASKTLSVLGLSSETLEVATHNSALAIRLADKLRRDCSKLLQTIEEMVRMNKAFFQPFIDQLPNAEKSHLILQTGLLASAVQGEVSGELKQWMESVHEQGFKRWYNAMSHNWDTILKIISEDILTLLEKLVLTWSQLQTKHGDLGTTVTSPRLDANKLSCYSSIIESLGLSDLARLRYKIQNNDQTMEQAWTSEQLAVPGEQPASHDQDNIVDEVGTMELSDLLYRVLAQIVPQQEVFEKQATYLESLFREEIDRPIAVTKFNSVTLTEVARMLLDGGLVGEVDIAVGREALNLAVGIQRQLNDHINFLSTKLRKHMSLAYKTDLGDEVKFLQRLHDKATHSNYALLLASGKRVILDSNGFILSTDNIEGISPVFTGNAADVISLDVESSCLILPNGERRQLDFEPAAVVVRQKAESLVACVLSEDHQHYQFQDI